MGGFPNDLSSAGVETGEEFFGTKVVDAAASHTHGATIHGLLLPMTPEDVLGFQVDG